jgi:putative addiction module CopG family antidote
MELTLKPEVEALIQQQLRSGRYHDPNDVLETALHALSDGIALRTANLDDFIQEGIDAADRGELYSEEEVRAHLSAVRSKL